MSPLLGRYMHSIRSPSLLVPFLPSATRGHSLPGFPAYASGVRCRPHRHLRLIATASSSESGGGAGNQNESSDVSSYTKRRSAILPVAEKSLASQEDLLLFFFLLDLSARLQRALNVSQFEEAQQLRGQIAQVEAEVKERRAKKTGEAKEQVTDKTVEALSLRAELQRAVEAERFADAAVVRDKLSKLEADMLAASALARANSNAVFKFRLGQRLRHRVFGYRAVVCGMDSVCCESEEWIGTAKVDELPGGRRQPFYQILVNGRDAEPNFQIAYVAEESLSVPCTVEKDKFDHPYIYLLFYGVDGNGDFIPSKQLRDKYNAPRHEISSDESDER